MEKSCDKTVDNSGNGGIIETRSVVQRVIWSNQKSFWKEWKKTFLLYSWGMVMMKVIENTDKKIGDSLIDEYGRKFNIDSVAFTNNHNTTTFVLTPLDGKRIIGSVLN